MFKIRVKNVYSPSYGGAKVKLLENPDSIVFGALLGLIVDCMCACMYSLLRYKKILICVWGVYMLRYLHIYKASYSLINSFINWEKNESL